MKHIALTLIIALAGSNALAMPADYFFSIYGKKAERHFNKMPKLTDACAYLQNEVDADGKPTDNVKMVIDGEQINSILCRRLGEQTYACEASTLLNDGACKTN